MPPDLSSEATPELLRSPPWSCALESAAAELAAAPQPERSEPSAKQATERAAARAHARLLVALDGGSNAGDRLIPELISSAVEVILGAATLTPAANQGPEELRAELAELLRQELSAREAAVLTGEITYAVHREDGDEQSARIRQAIMRGSEHQPMSHGDFLSLRIAAVKLAALLVRAAANCSVGGHADDAPRDRSPTLDATLRAIMSELTAGARHTERSVGGRGDVIAHHLAAGLRVRAPHDTLQALTTAVTSEQPDAGLRERARDYWLRLATVEYVAVLALDDQLEEPAYDERFEDLSAAIVESAANVICGARLIDRPSAFRHAAAWDHQAVGLSYALEAYVAGLHGDAPSLEQTQLITLTRLVRAVAAVALLDVRREDTPASSRRSKR